MKKSKREKLKRAGWNVGSTEEFLDLSPEEAALVGIKQSLMQLVRETRAKKDFTQINLAQLLGSSQSRIAKLENGSSDISLDLLVRALFAMGVSPKQLGKTIASL